MRKYDLTDDMLKYVQQEVYQRWLYRKAAAHVKRDRKRGNESAKPAAYRIAIHAAVCKSGGVDAYTGEKLDWTLLSQYDNAQSQKHKRKYKHSFALLPTVDHVGDGLGAADFKICAWRTNDAKNDLSYEEFVALCHRVITKAGSI